MIVFQLRFSPTGMMTVLRCGAMTAIIIRDGRLAVVHAGIAT